MKVTYKDADNNEQTVKATVDEKDANVYTFAMPAYPVNVSAEFAKEYKVTVADTANKNGETKVSATAAVEGTEVTVTVKAADNYQLKADSLTYSYKSGEDTKTEKLTPNSKARLPLRCPQLMSMSLQSMSKRNPSLHCDSEQSYQRHCNR